LHYEPDEAEAKIEKVYRMKLKLK